MTEIEMDKRYRTRDGREVRILCIDGPDKRHPVCGFIEGEFAQWDKKGRWWVGTEDSHCDLVDVPEEITLEGWANVYDEPTNSLLHKSKDDADRCAFEDRIACVPITITFKRGDGIDVAEGGDE